MSGRAIGVFFILALGTAAFWGLRTLLAGHR